MKLKVWHKEEKRWVIFDALFFDSDMQLWKVRDKPNQINYFPHEIEICRFTGLLDKEGVEIYEGDIVKVKEINDCGTVYVMKNVIEYVSSMGAYSIFAYCMHNRFQDRLDEPNPYVFEVIGNIYSNPELCEAQS